ncbi:hypothetical protein MMC18_008240 [Xylographa bjoerkii]|nr:hypothetical protein [Xylographa bjoerkii]
MGPPSHPKPMRIYLDDEPTYTLINLDRSATRQSYNSFSIKLSAASQPLPPYSTSVRYLELVSKLRAGHQLRAVSGAPDLLSDHIPSAISIAGKAATYRAVQTELEQLGVYYSTGSEVFPAVKPQLFVLADEAPPPIYTPIAPDYPTTSNTPTSSTYTVTSAQVLPSIDSISGPATLTNIQDQHLSLTPVQAQPPASTITRLQTRRRRRRSSSEPTEGESPVEVRRVSVTAQANSAGSANTGRPAAGPRRDTPSSPKRPRLMSRDMRNDLEKSTSSANGTRYHTNGSSLPTLQKSASSTTSNGFSGSINGGSAFYTNGSTPVTARARPLTYFGHDREEVARLLIQGLNDLGYSDTAHKLVQESGYDLESPSVAAFRHAILNGEWSEAESLLFGSQPSNDGGGVSISNGNGNRHEGLVLAEGVDKDVLRFRLRRQKYLELLEERDHGGALMVLRQELTPLHQDVGQLHILSGLMVCQSAEELKSQALWDGAHGSSRNLLLSDLSRSISPSVMIPDHRLAVLLDQVKQTQITNCLYHNPTTSPSLFSDHICDRSQFPLQTHVVLVQTHEVWFVQFSHDGRRLATGGESTSITIYDTIDFQIRHTLSEHTKAVAYAAWSPDDTKLVTCSHDFTAKVWDTLSGQRILSVVHGEEPVTSAAWAPNGQTFITGSLDKQSSLHIWNLSGDNIHVWSDSTRVQDLALSPDGKRLVIISPEREITVYNFTTWNEEYSLRLKTKLTCVRISRDSKYMLINMVDNELQLIDIGSAEIVRRFLGQKQGEYIIRGSFGGADENLIISGSEDGRIYIWHRENGTLIETLEGHPGGCANAVAWNPADSCMFASGGDDKKVKIWSKEASNETRRRHSSTGSYRTHAGRTFDAASGTLV